MSLAFLAKKSWHTANLRNVEKVWIAEQKHAAEEKKVEELRKNIEEERQLQELRQLQAARGDKSAAVERLDWMYEGPSAAGEKTAEEYLLGKEYEGEDEKAVKGDLDLSSTTKYGSLALTKTALPANDAFQRLNEDPMMLIRKRQQATREQVLKNPVKMNRIKAHVDRLKEDKKTRKKAKKAAKKEKKHARREEKRLKKKRKHEDASDGSGDEEEKTAHRSRDYPSKHHHSYGRSQRRSASQSKNRSKSPGPARHGDSRERSHTQHTRRESERRGRSPINHRPSRSSPDRYVDARRHRKSLSHGRRSVSPAQDRCYGSRSPSPRRHEPRGRSRSRSVHDRDDFGRDKPPSRPIDRSVIHRSRTPPRRDHVRDSDRRDRDRRERSRPRSPRDHRGSRRSRSPGNKRENQREHSHSRRERIDRASDSGDVRQDQRHKESDSRRKPLDVEGKYGLVSKAGAVESKDIDKTSLGPNAKHLAKAREAKRLDEEERRRKLGKSSRGESRQLNDDEKKRMAEQMVEDAKQRDEYVVKRATRKQDELDKREKVATSTNPEFLRKLHSEAYLDGESNMSDRLRRNAHYIQRKADASNFLSK